ncbi:MAG: BstXI family restriction endonuclease [Candidatus Latescibacteria bacterium]|nr:BstXI family restriction endonuclease [Candidatus Latescibacterota bacterium]
MLDRKIYKTGQTRGADDDVIFQNRVARSSTVLIPYNAWPQCRVPSTTERTYENGYIVLLSPTEYFASPTIAEQLRATGLALGQNTLVFYETREQWNANNPETLGWSPASQRQGALGGQYVARVPATTAAPKIVRGFNSTTMKGAGIRVYEYARSITIEQCRSQLEALYWMCRDSNEAATSNGMTPDDASSRRARTLENCQTEGLLDKDRLRNYRIINANDRTICPLCLDELSAHGFFSRMAQAAGREVPDLTVTQLNLFHIEELRTGVLNHRPYNVGWGHHHCNVVVKDSGVTETLRWMREIIDRNIRDGHLPASNSGK